MPEGFSWDEVQAKDPPQQSYSWAEVQPPAPPVKPADYNLTPVDEFGRVTEPAMREPLERVAPVPLQPEPQAPQAVPGQTLPGAIAKGLGAGLERGSAAVVAAVPTLVSGLAANDRAAPQRQLDLLDRLDAGQPVPPMAIPRGWLGMSPEQRQAYRADLQAQVVQSDVRGPIETWGEQAGQGIRQQAEANVARNAPIDPRFKDNVAVKLAGMAGETAPLLVGAVLGGLPGAAGVAFTQGYGSTFEDARIHGQNPQDAHVSGLLNGAASAALITPAAAAWLGALTPEVKTIVVRAVLNMAVGSATQVGISEAQKVATNAVAQRYDPTRPLTQGAGEDMVENAILGAAFPLMHDAAGLAGAAGQRLQQAQRPVAPELQTGLDAWRLQQPGPPGPPGAPPAEPPPSPPAPGGAGLSPTQVLTDIANGGTGAPPPPPGAPPGDVPSMTIRPGPGEPGPGEPVPGEPVPAEPPPPEATTQPPPQPPASGAVMVRPGELTSDPKTFQYKESDGAGVTGVLRGTNRWEPDLADPITVWQAEDGRNVVVNGHQRLDLARRAEAAGQPDVQMPARIYRAADGFTPEYMRVLGAFQNIAQGSGSPVDAARVLRDVPSLPEELRVRLPGLSTTGAVMREAQGLARLSDNAWGMVTNGLIEPQYAAQVGALITDPRMQAAAMAVLQRGNPANTNQARLIVQDVLAQDLAAQHEQAQGMLPGMAPEAASVVPERAAVLDSVIRMLRQSRARLSGAIQGEAVLTGIAGNQINVPATHAAKEHNDQLITRIQADALVRGPLSDALTTAAKDLAGGRPIAAAGAQFLAEARKIIARSGEAGLQRGAPAGGADPASESPAPVAGQSDLLAAPQEDLFGRRQTLPQDQGDLFRQAPPPPAPAPGQTPVGTAAASRFPNTVDKLAQVPVHSPTEAHRTAVDWVRGEGSQTGHEHIAIVDPATGRIIAAGTDNETMSVRIPIPQDGSVAPNSLVVHHSHPNNTAISRQDILAASHTAISHIAAVATDGAVSVVSLPPADSHPDAQRGLLVTEGTKNHTFIRTLLQALVDHDVIDVPSAQRALGDLRNRLMAAKGLIDYQSSFEHPPVLMQWFSRALREMGVPDDAVDRHTRSVGPDRILANLPGAVPAGQRGARAAGVSPGTGGGAPGAGAAEASAGAGDRLAAEDRENWPRTPLYSAVVRAVEGLKQTRGTAEQMLSQIQKTPGVKKDELDWLGVPAFLAGKKSVTQQELADFVRAQQLDVREVEHGDSRAADAAYERMIEAHGARTAAMQAIRAAIDHVPPGTTIVTRGHTYTVHDDYRAHWVVDDVEAGRLDPAQVSDPTLAQAIRDWQAADRVYTAANVTYSEAAHNTRPTAYAGYKTAGGDDYRELVLTTPDHSAALKQQLDQTWDAVGDAYTAYTAANRANHDDQTHPDVAPLLARWRQLVDARDALERQLDAVKPYRSSHWDQSNVVAHVRYDTRTLPDGRKVLFIQEIQSDWHQDGRKLGYAGDAPQLTDLERWRVVPDQHLVTGETVYYVINGEGRTRYNRPERTEASAQAMVTRENDHLLATKRDKQVPAAPFRNSWPMLMMKRMVKFAVDNGYEMVQWAPGSEHAKRYPWVPESTIQGNNFFYDKRLAKETQELIRKFDGKVVETHAPGTAPEVTEPDAIAVRQHQMRSRSLEIQLNRARIDDNWLRYDEIAAQLADLRLRMMDETRARDAANPRPGLPVLGFAITPRMAEVVGGEGLPLFARRLPEKPVGLYSAVGRAVGALRQAKGTGEQMLAAIEKTPGVKPEELAVLGLGDWLRGQKSVTQQQIADYVAANSLQVHEQTLGDSTEADAAQRRVAATQAALDASYEQLRAAMRGADADTLLTATDGGQRTLGSSHFDVIIDLQDGELRPDGIPAGPLRDAAAHYVAAWQAHSDAGAAYNTAAVKVSATKYGSYTLPGGEGYRELLLTLPGADAPAQLELQRLEHAVQAGYDDYIAAREAAGRDDTPEVQAALQSYRAVYAQLHAVERQLDDSAGYRSGHWDPKNIVAHVRYDTRVNADGTRTLFIQEIQSDWHQQGRQHGYAGEPPKLSEAERWRVEAVRDTAGQVVGWHAQDGTGRTATVRPFRDQAAAQQEAERLDGQILYHKRAQQPPPAPFRTSWPMLAMKRMILHAVEQGFDRVAWAPGSEHIRRYPGVDAKQQAGLKGFYDTKLPGDVAALIKRFGGKIEPVQIPRPQPQWSLPAIDETAHTEHDPAWDALERQIEAHWLTDPDRADALIGERVRLEQRMMDETAARQRQADQGIPAQGFQITQRMRDAVQQEGLPLFARREAAAAGATPPAPPTPLSPAAHQDRLAALAVTARGILRFLGVPEAVRLRFADSLRAAAEVGGQRADAAYDPVRRVIAFALDTPAQEGPIKFYHEIIHALRSLDLLTPRQNKALEVAAERWLNDPNRGWERKKAFRDAGIPQAQWRDEAIAIMAEGALRAGETGRSVLGAAAHLWRNFTTGLGQALRRQGFLTADDVFSGLMGGERATPAARPTLAVSGLLAAVPPEPPAGQEDPAGAGGRAGGTRPQPSQPSVQPTSHAVNGMTIVLPESYLSRRLPAWIYNKAQTSRVAGAAVKADEAREKVATGLAHWVSPMTAGSARAQDVAFRFANALRAVQYQFDKLDRSVTDRFGPQQRERMGRAMDNQSVFEQELQGLPPGQWAQARQLFDARKDGVAGLAPAERQVVEELAQLAGVVWGRMQAKGMVAPTAAGLPYYFARQIVMRGPGDAITLPDAPGRGGAGGLTDVHQLGRNLSTMGAMTRQYLHPQDTLDAAKLKYGPTAELVTDIRSVVQRLASQERGIAGVDLVKEIEQIGQRAGVSLIAAGTIPGLLNASDYVTIAHPALRQYVPGGYQDIKVAKELEGPLKAVLTAPTGDVYRAAMALKGGVMHLIMYSPFMHLAVEMGRAFPLMPGKIVSLRVFFAGNRLMKDDAYMRNAIQRGVVPIGRGWSLDPVRIAEEARVGSGMLDRIKQSPFGRAAVTAWDFYANRLLWDNIRRLQVGIYDEMRARNIAKGFSPEIAEVMAAHVANRYAGALPPEHLAKWANQAANLLLFSRSFTLGNLAVMKDVLSGAPQHIRNHIMTLATEQAGGNAAAGERVAARAQGALRKKAFAAFALDLGVMALANAVLQEMWQVATRAPDLGLPAAAQQVYEEWREEAASSLASAHENPLNVLGVLPGWHNEPGKRNRIYMGNDSQGRGAYMRFAAGKVGEEFLGWMTSPGTMLLDKLSPQFRPLMESILGEDTLHRGIIKPDPQTITDYIDNAGRVAWHMIVAETPAGAIQGAYDYVRGAPGDPRVNLGKALLPFTGIGQVSSGYPLGPEDGKSAAQRRGLQWDRQRVMPAVREAVQRGDRAAAEALLRGIAESPADIRRDMRSVSNPAIGKRSLEKWRHDHPTLSRP